MKKIMQWVLAATLIYSTSYFTSCSKANAQEDDPVPPPTVKSQELVRTSQSWDGVELPDYLKGRPELVAVKYEFPVGQKLGWHHHPVMNYGILVQGELTIIGQDGKEKVVHEGEAVVEMVNTIHHGENRGTKPVILYNVLPLTEGHAPGRAASRDTIRIIRHNITNRSMHTKKVMKAQWSVSSPFLLVIDIYFLPNLISTRLARNLATVSACSPLTLITRS